MRKGEHKTTLQSETVFVLQGFFPPHKDGGGQHTPGRWTTLYGWAFVAKDSRDRLDEGSRARLKILKEKAQGWTGIPGKLNLHHDGLAYVERADAHEAVRRIREWKCCKYKVRVVRETQWTEVVIDDYPKEPLQRPFYWPPGSAGDPAATPTVDALQEAGLVKAGRITTRGRRALGHLGQRPTKAKCRAKVQSYHDVFPRQCANRAVHDGYCRVHQRKTRRRK